jgi:hypothetical protein
LTLIVGSVVQRYRVKYTVYDGGSYTLKYREVRSLREAGEFIKLIVDSDSQEFNEVRLITYAPLSIDEMRMLVFFTDGRLKES